MTQDLHRTPTIGSGRGQTDPLELPYGTVADGGNLDEFVTETKSGNIVKPVKSNVTGKEEDYNLVTFTIDDPDNPKNWSKAYKWWCTIVVAFTCFVVAFASSVITADLEGVAEDFHVSREVTMLPITVFVVGFGVG